MPSVCVCVCVWRFLPLPLTLAYARFAGGYFPADELFEMDGTACCNDCNFFPFGDVLTRVVRAFSRDVYVRRNAGRVTHEPIEVEVEGETGEGETGEEGTDAEKVRVTVPSSGVHPFKGFVKYAAPLSLIYEGEEVLYFTFRNMYSQLWCKLNSVDASTDGIVRLCKTFEDLLYAQHPHLFLHLLAIKVNPLQIAFPWIHLAFTGVLPVRERNFRASDR